MDRVYRYLINRLLAPFVGLGDDDDAVARYKALDVNNANEVEQLIRSILLPHFAGFSTREQELTKTCLRYYLSDANTPFGEIFDAILPPFDLGAKPHKFFISLWKVLFGVEPFILDQREQYIVDNRPEVTYLKPEVYDKSD